MPPNEDPPKLTRPLPTPPPPPPKVACDPGFGPHVLSKDLIDDCGIMAEDILRMMTEPSPPRKPIVQPEPSIEFIDAGSALRSMLESGCDATDGSFGDRVCFYCGSMLDYEPHSDKCCYIAVKSFIDKADQQCPTTPASPPC